MPPVVIHANTRLPPLGVDHIFISRVPLLTRSIVCAIRSAGHNHTIQKPMTSETLSSESYLNLGLQDRIPELSDHRWTPAASF